VTVRKSLHKCKECGNEFVVASEWREGDEERALEHFGPIPICPECGHHGSELLDANHQGLDDADG